MRARRPREPPLDDLREVVGEAEQRAGERDAEHADRARRELRQQQERHRDRGEDDDPAHRRRARLGVVLLRPVLADVLAELALAQERDELRRQEDAHEQGRGPRDQDLAHQPAACSASVTTSSPTPREPLTSTTSPAEHELGQQRGGLAGVGDRVRLAVELVEHRGRARARPSRAGRPPPRPRRRRSRGGARARRGRARACRRAPPRGGPRLVRGEIVEGGAHGERVGVVAVVDDDGPDPERHALAPHRGEADVDRAARRARRSPARRRPRRAR